MLVVMKSRTKQNKENEVRKGAITLIATKGNVDNLETWNAKELMVLLKSMKLKNMKRATNKPGMLAQIRAALDTTDGKAILYEGLFRTRELQQQVTNKITTHNILMADVESERMERKEDEVEELAKMPLLKIL